MAGPAGDAPVLAGLLSACVPFVAGWPISSLLPRTFRRPVVTRLAMAWLLGAAWCGGLALAASRLGGFPLRRTTLLPIVLLPLLIGVLAWPKSLLPGRPRRPSLPGVCTASIVGVSGLALLAGALMAPVFDWDGLMTWNPQARLIRFDRTATPDSFTDPWVWVSHPQYPPLVALVQVTGLEIVSAPEDERAGRGVHPFFFVALLAVLYRTLRVLSKGGQAAAISTSLAAMTPFLAFNTHGGAAGAFSDVPLAAFLGGGLAILLCGGVRVRAGASAGLLLAAAVLTKNEGFPLVLGLLAVVGVSAGRDFWVRRGSGRGLRLRKAVAASLLIAAFVGASAVLLHEFKAQIPNRYDEDYRTLVTQGRLDPPVMARKALSVVPFLLSRFVSVRDWGILWPLIGLLALLHPRVLARRASLAAGALALAPIGLGFAAFAVHWDPVELARVTVDRFLVQGSFGAFLLLGLLLAVESRSEAAEMRVPGAVRAARWQGSPLFQERLGRLRRAIPSLEELFTFAIGTAIARQALWLMPGRILPVVLSAAAGFAVVVAVRRSAHERPSPPRLFWLVVALPILVLWALRVPLPDIGYDALNYHVMHGERGLWGPLFPPGDFYPYFFPYLNPAADLVTALFRAVLGYRGGTLASALALVWTGQILWRLLASVVRDERARAVAVLLAVTTEGMLWEVSGYMVDLLSLPVLLEATRLALAEVRPSRPLHRRTATLGLLLGVAVALKLTNLVFAVPIGIVALVRWLGPRSARPGALAIVGAAVAGAAAMALPVAPHALLLLARTGNPVFPYFNRLFASPFYPEADIKDGRWGPVSRVQALAWPLLSALRPERFSEFLTTTGRLAAGWLAAFVALAVFWKDACLRAVSGIVLVGGLLWSLGTGYQRYGLFLELLGGFLLVLLAARLFQGPCGDDPGRAVTPVSRVAAAGLVLLLGAQSARSIFLAIRSDWSGRPTVFDHSDSAARDALLLLRDRDLRSFLSPEERKAIPENPIWIDVGTKSNGIMTLLDRHAPMIGLQVEGFLAEPLNLRLLDAALTVNRGRTGCAIAFEQDASATESNLARLGFPVRRRTSVDFPFFSKERRLGLVFFEVGLPPPLGVEPANGVRTPWAADVLMRGSMDGPEQGQRVRGELLVRGWAREPGEDLLVTILVGGVEVPLSSFRRVPRLDVAAAIPKMGDCSTAGYEAIVPRPPGAPAEVEVSVAFRSRSGRMRYYPGVKVRWEETAAEAPVRP